MTEKPSKYQQLTTEEALEELRKLNEYVLAQRKKRLRVVRIPDRGGAAFTIKIIEVPD